MDRDLWKRIVAGLRVVPRRRPRNAVYTNRQVLVVFMWAALHDRPVSWACERRSWPPSAWRRIIPDQSTMSRRTRDPSFLTDLKSLLCAVQRMLPTGSRLIVDGKALPIACRTIDRDARNGWASGGYARGYKLHIIIDDAQRVRAFDIHPMNAGEPLIAAGLVRRMPASRGAVMLGDAAYDSNPLHSACAARGVTLYAPRRRPGTSISAGRAHHPARIACIRALEGDDPPAIVRERAGVERFFSSLTIAGRLFALPPWARRLHRVRAWVAAKLIVNAARIALKHTVDA